jgi:hypothetical protein
VAEQDLAEVSFEDVSFDKGRAMEGIDAAKSEMSRLKFPKANPKGFVLIIEPGISSCAVKRLAFKPRNNKKHHFFIINDLEI